ADAPRTWRDLARWPSIGCPRRDARRGQYARPAPERRSGRHGRINVRALSDFHLARPRGEKRRAADSERMLRDRAGARSSSLLHVATDLLNERSTSASVRPSRRAWTWGLVLAVAIPSFVNVAIIA